jgi:hypothetical protein
VSKAHVGHLMQNCLNTHRTWACVLVSVRDCAFLSAMMQEVVICAAAAAWNSTQAYSTPQVRADASSFFRCFV